MPTLHLAGVEIEFPHEPYDCQLTYMHNLLESLQLVEWRFVNMQSRSLFDDSHNFLAIVISLVFATFLRSRNVSVIGSRDQLCLLPEVTSLDSSSAKVFACRGRVQTRTCDYYRNFDMKRDSLMNTIKAEGVVDIEDLVKLGKSTSCCPYYMSRELKTNAEIIFTPYNYLLDPKIRKLYNIELQNTAVIFDEAHNIEQVCEDAASVNLSSSVLAAAIEYLRVVCEVVFSLTAQTQLNDAVPTEDVLDAQSLASYDISRAGEDKCQLIELERLIDELQVGADGFSKSSDFMFDLLARAGFNAHTKEMALSTIEEVLSVAAAAENLKLRKPKGISEISEFLKVVFDSKNVSPHSNIFSLLRLPGVDYSHCYRVFAKDEQLANRGRVTADRVWDSRGVGSNQPVTDRTLSYWCLSPGRAMQDLIKERVRCVILTSGTLYPIEPIQSELHMNFPISLQNPHVIKPEQVRLAVITHGKDGIALNSSYATRDKPEYRTSLGMTLVEIIQIVPAGLLVFFTSYGMMSQCIDAWKNEQLYDKMLRYKRIFVEPRDKVQFAKVFSDYRDVASGAVPCDVNGAALFAVMRGRASEGLDLADFAGRGVVVLGLPYPPFHDARVRLKMSYLDEQLAELNNQASRSGPNAKAFVASHPTGKKWYNQQAWRAVNQSIGRVIRHHRDFGAIFLCDERFAQVSARSQFPHWMQPSMRIYTNLRAALEETSTFYKRASILYPTSSAGSSTSYSYLTKSTSTAKPIDARISSAPLAGRSSNYPLPRATQVDMFARSLGPQSSDGDSVLANYAGSQTLPDFLPVGVKSSSSSVFDFMDQSACAASQAILREASVNKDENLEIKLLKGRPTKRIKLLRPEAQKLSSSPFLSDPSTYVEAVKSALTKTDSEHPNGLKLRTFKQAMQSYREYISKVTPESSANANVSQVEALHKKLCSIFSSPETSSFVSDFHSIVLRFVQTLDIFSCSRFLQGLRVCCILQTNPTFMNSSKGKHEKNRMGEVNKRRKKASFINQLVVQIILTVLVPALQSSVLNAGNVRRALHSYPHANMWLALVAGVP
ncbi:DNA repair helicase, partial [Opisthorchis viverrini]